MINAGPEDYCAKAVEIFMHQESRQWSDIFNTWKRYVSMFWFCNCIILRGYFRRCGTESRRTSWEVKLARTYHSAGSIIFNRLEMTKLPLLEYCPAIFYRYQWRYLLSSICQHTYSIITTSETNVLPFRSIKYYTELLV